MLRKWLFVVLLIGLSGIVPASFAGSGGPLTPGETINANIREPGEQDVYTYNGRLNERVVISMNASGGSALDTALELYDPYGTRMAANDDADLAGGNTNSLIYATLPYDGEYRVIARSFGSGSTGAYDLLITVENPEFTPTEGSVLQLDQPVNATLVTGEYAIWTITPADDISVEIRMISDEFDTLLEVYDSTNEILFRDDDSGGDGDAYISNLPLSAGETYQVWARSYNDTGSGAYTLTVAPMPPPPPAQPISYGETVDGSLGSGQAASYAFTGSAEDVITVVMTGNFDAKLELLDSANNEVASDDDSGGNFLPFLNGITLPADDTYTLVIRGYDASAYGLFTLTLREGGVEVAQDVRIDFEETVEGFLPTSEAASYIFSGTAGDVITISVDASFDSVLEFYDANERFLTSDDDSGGNANPLIENLTLTETGDFQIVLRGFGSTDAGTYALTLTRGSGITTSDPGVKPGETIIYGERAAGELAAGDTVSYTFAGQANDVIRVTVTSSFDSVLELADASGTILTGDDDSGGEGQPLLENVTLPETGDYTLTLRGYSAFDSGSYDILVELESGGSTTPATDTPPSTGDALAYGDMVEGDLVPGQESSYSFTASEGDVITISATAEYDGYLELRDAAGELITTDDDTGEGFNPLIENFTIATAGAYTITFSSFGGQGRGAFTLTLTAGNTATATPDPIVTTEPPTSTPVPTEAPPTATPEPTEVAALDQPLVFDQTSIQTLPVGGTLTYSFDGQSGDQISLAAAPSDFESGLDLYVELYAPSGTLIAADDDSGWLLNPELYGVTLIEDGVHKVQIRSYSSDGSGEFYLTLVHGAAHLSPTGQAAQPVAYGVENTVSQPSLYEFTAAEGEEILITANGVQVHAYTAGAQDVEIIENAFTAPADGTYLFLAIGNGTFTVDQAVPVVPYPPTVTAQGILLANEPVNGAIDPNETDQWQFTPGVSGTYNIVVNSEDPTGQYDPYIRVLDASGAVIAEDDDSGGNFNALVANLSVAEPVTIEVTSFAGQVGGKYLLAAVTAESGEVSTLTGGDLSLGTASEPVTLAAPGQAAEFTLEIAEKGLFNFTIEGLTIPVIEVVNAEGDVLALGIGTLKNQLLDPGSYTVRISDRLNRTGEFTLTVDTAE